MQKTVTFQVYDQNNIPETIWGNNDLDLFFFVRDSKIELTYRRNELAFIKLGSSKENNTVEMPVVDLPTQNGLYKINHKEFIVVLNNKIYEPCAIEVETGINFGFTPEVHYLEELFDVTAFHIEKIMDGDVTKGEKLVWCKAEAEEYVVSIEEYWRKLISYEMKKAIHEDMFSIAERGLGWDKLNEMFDDFANRYLVVKRQHD